MMIEQVTQQPMGTWQRVFYAGPSADALHEDYAKRGRIDDLAPIASRCEIVVDAPVERVWELLMDTDAVGSCSANLSNGRASRRRSATCGSMTASSRTATSPGATAGRSSPLDSPSSTLVTN